MGKKGKTFIFRSMIVTKTLGQSLSLRLALPKCDSWGVVGSIPLHLSLSLSLFFFFFF